MFHSDNGGFQPGERDANEAYLMDRIPDYFKPILSYLRTNEVFISGVELHGIQNFSVSNEVIRKNIEIFSIQVYSKRPRISVLSQWFRYWKIF